jgi:hypothetical protein
MNIDCLVYGQVTRALRELPVRLVHETPWLEPRALKGSFHEKGICIEYRSMWTRAAQRFNCWRARRKGRLSERCYAYMAQLSDLIAKQVPFPETEIEESSIKYVEGNKKVIITDYTLVSIMLQDLRPKF